MKNLPLILNIVLFALVGHLYYLNFSKNKSAEQVIAAPASQSGGVKIAYVNGDTLDAQYIWLKKQKDAIQQRMEAARTVGRKAAEGDVAAVQALPKVISRAEEGVRLIDELGFDPVDAGSLAEG